MSKPQNQPDEYEHRMARKLQKVEQFGTVLKAFREVVQDALGPRLLQRVMLRASELRPQTPRPNLSGNPVVQEHAQNQRIGLGLGLMERFQRSPWFSEPPTEEELQAAEELQHQAIEAKREREKREAEQRQREKEVENLRRIRDEWGDVQVSG